MNRVAPSAEPDPASCPSLSSLQPRRDPVLYYRIRRAPAGVRAWAIRESGQTEPVPHLVRHSPTGFEIGYGGSGPADLARSILGHHLETTDPDPSLYQDFKGAFLSSPDTRDGIDIGRGDIERWLESRVAQASA